MRAWWPLLALLMVLQPALATAQAFDVLGTRAAGMGGAFVAVADDASAVYWNPGALAQGAFFSLLLDVSNGEATPDDAARIGEGSRSAGIIALGLPALGVSYYRLRSSRRLPIAGTDQARLENLITDHTGVTLVQSLANHISVGSTLKLVHGAAAAGFSPDLGTGDPSDLVGLGSTHFDFDAGILATFGSVRAGLTGRNLAAPTFDTLGGGDSLQLDRQVRAGVALTTAVGVLVAVDADLTRNHGSLGDERSIAAGAETRVGRRAFARAGVRFNTLDTPAGATPAVAVGGSYAATASLLIDGEVTTGSASADRGWGVAARLVF